MVILVPNLILKVSEVSKLIPDIFSPILFTSL
jgi:hypothetical protein